MSIEDTAKSFFEACEGGKGWDACQAYCHPDASFSCQADALAETKTLAAYTEWMKGLFGPIPDAGYELTGFATDSERATVIASAVFKGTQTGAGGPMDPTGKSVESDYAYVMVFKDDLITHMTKIWNDAQAIQQLGWA